VPILTIIAGPNGSGKSTITRSAEFEGRERLLDPDAIAREMNPLHPSAAAIPAGRETLKRTAEYLTQGVSFAVETTLSGHGKLDLLRQAKSRRCKLVKADVPRRLFRRPRRLPFPKQRLSVRLRLVRIAVAVTLLRSSGFQSQEVFSQRVANQPRAIPLGTMRGPVGRL
jgi:hypothetical protein